MRNLLFMSMLWATNVMAQPIVNFFELHTQESGRQVFAELGQQNIQSSYQKEQGTLTMLAFTLFHEPDSHYVFEIYQDSAAYQQHLQSAHFQHFFNESKKILKRKLAKPIDLVFVSGKQELSPQEMKDFHLFMAQQQMSDDRKAVFVQQIQDWVTRDTAISAVYVMRDKQQSSQWRIIVVSSQDAKPGLPLPWQSVQNMFSFERGSFRSK